MSEQKEPQEQKEVQALKEPVATEEANVTASSEASADEEKMSQQEMWMRIHRQTKQINAQLEQLNNHKLVHTYNSLPRFIWFSLVKGIAVGLGSVLGATVVLSFLVYVLSQMEFIPILGEWITAILEVVKKPETN